MRPVLLMAEPRELSGRAGGRRTSRERKGEDQGSTLGEKLTGCKGFAFSTSPSPPLDTEGGSAGGGSVIQHGVCLVSALLCPSRVG